MSLMEEVVAGPRTCVAMEGLEVLKLWSAGMAAQMVKNLPAMQKTSVRFLGWEDPPGG